ncbi:MAG: hypothetical protein AAB309_00695 [Deltaproteobacteria bacterium]
MGYYMKKEQEICVFTQPVEFFRNLVTAAIGNQKVTLEADVEYYLVSLLSQYMQTAMMKKSEGAPLAIRLHQALVAAPSEKVQILKEVGDFSLYISGFFSDSLNRKIVDIDYYMAMGGAAYLKLSHAFTHQNLQALYRDLFERFGTCVDILAEVSDITFSSTNKDLLRLYEKWLKTKSVRVAELLKKAGLFPLENIPTDFQ